MYRTPTLLFVLSSGAFAQQSPPLIQLKQYLQLTDGQYVTVFDNINEYVRKQSESQQRINQLQQEIAAETVRQNPSPLEIGTRYTEIETTCRAMAGEGQALAERNKALLTDPQKPRLKTLQDTVKLFPLLSQAQSLALIGSIGFAYSGVYANTGYAGNILRTPIPADRWFNTALFVSPYAFGPGCQPRLQLIALPPAGPDLKDYLLLTDAQIAQFQQNISSRQGRINETQQRINQLRIEIAMETARETPNPMEIGTRYVEIELISRVVCGEGSELSETNRALLTDAQKTKMQPLDDALKLSPVISEAQSAGFLEGGPVGAISIPTAVIRSGDFSLGVCPAP